MSQFLHGTIIHGILFTLAVLQSGTRLFPVNNFRHRIVNFVGLVNFSHAQFLANTNKATFVWVGNRCSLFPVLVCFQIIFLKKY